jgi:hypothetical protein
VTLARCEDEDVRDRQVVARLGDRKPLILYFGDRVTLDVEPGQHRLRVHNTLVWKTLVLDVGSGDHLDVSLLNYAPKFTLGLLAIVGAGPLLLKVAVTRRPARQAV